MTSPNGHMRGLLQPRGAAAVSCMLVHRSGDRIGVAKVDLLQEIRALWVLRTSLTSPESIATLVRSAQEHGFNTFFVQVRGRGDASCSGGVEPRASELLRQPDSSIRSPRVLRRVTPRDCASHAWVNVNLISSAVDLPIAREHIVYRHPSWLMVPRDIAQELGVMRTGEPGVRREARAAGRGRSWQTSRACMRRRYSRRGGLHRLDRERPREAIRRRRASPRLRTLPKRAFRLQPPGDSRVPRLDAIADSVAAPGVSISRTPWISSPIPTRCRTSGARSDVARMTRADRSRARRRHTRSARISSSARAAAPDDREAIQRRLQDWSGWLDARPGRRASARWRTRPSRRGLPNRSRPRARGRRRTGVGGHRRLSTVAARKRSTTSRPRAGSAPAASSSSPTTA